MVFGHRVGTVIISHCLLYDHIDNFLSYFAFTQDQAVDVEALAQTELQKLLDDQQKVKEDALQALIEVREMGFELF